MIVVDTNTLLMKIIKLNAIASTNSFLKDMVANSNTENFTVVVAKKQVSGKGQMQSKWISEAGKNLTFSVFYSFKNLKIDKQKYLNFAISVSIFEVLQTFNLPKLTIKWPNDILSDKYKICGILIENSLKGLFITSSIIGIGLNVNQEKFPPNIGNASSIKNILQKELNLDTILNAILEKMKQNIQLLNEKQYSTLELKYLNVLYKKGVPSMYKNKKDNLFMGKIVGISNEGKLQIELNDETVAEFGLKEVSFVY